MAARAHGQGLEQPLASPLTPFLDALPVPRRLIAAEHKSQLTVQIRTATHRFHRDLPESRIWGYDGTVPGPTIEAERGKPVMVEWRNELEGPLPVVETVAPKHAYSDNVPVQCLPGLSGGTPDPRAGALSGHTVVHLHGGLTPASYDGWAENLFAPGQPAVFPYPMNQRAALLWYHDHVMGVTKFDVYAGLAGLWIVRDDRERATRRVVFTIGDDELGSDYEALLQADLDGMTPEQFNALQSLTWTVGTEISQLAEKYPEDLPKTRASVLENARLTRQLGPKK